nr:hypothetical protein [uncultured Anaerobutyricum sp.]
MKLGKKKSVEYKLVGASCSSYLLGIVCLTVFGYFYEKLPFRDVLYMIPICLLFLGAIFSGISNMYAYNPFGENIEFSKNDIEEIATWIEMKKSKGCK